MPIDLVKLYFFDRHNFYQYLLQKNIDGYGEQNKDIKVRENPVYFKYITLMTLNEANMHYSKHGPKEMFVTDQKRMEMLNEQLIDSFQTLQEIYDEDSPNLIQTIKELDFLLKHNYKTPSCLDNILVNKKLF